MESLPDGSLSSALPASSLVSWLLTGFSSLTLRPPLLVGIFNIGLLNQLLDALLLLMGLEISHLYPVCCIVQVLSVFIFFATKSFLFYHLLLPFHIFYMWSNLLTPGLVFGPLVSGFKTSAIGA